MILGIVFGLVQLRHFHLPRGREAALLLMNSIQSVEFYLGVWIIQVLQNGLTKNEIEDRLVEDIRSIYFVINTWDSIGILVFKHEISNDMVVDACSGQIILSWQRLEIYVTEMRYDLQHETKYEWFQWLAERMIEREKTETPVPAYLAKRDWE